jgi:hypothetical protein
VGSVHGAVDHGATGPPWSGSHYHTWELTEARPMAAPVPESSGQGAGEGKEWSMRSMAGSPRVGRRWRGVSPMASGSAMVVTVVELRSGGNERGRTSARCEGARCSDAFYRAKGRSGGGWPLKGIDWVVGSDEGLVLRPF